MKKRIKQRQEVVDSIDAPSPAQVGIQLTNEGSSSSGPRETRTFQNIYTRSQRINVDDDEFSMLYLFAGYYPLAFEEAFKEVEWRKAMEEEMNAITKSNT